MRKLALSVGLVAVGTAGLHAEYAPGLNSMQTSKIWSLSGTLRGFYDDNYNTAPSGSANRRSSIGFEVSPSFSLNVPLEQTEIGLRYTYGLFYYQDRQDRGVNPVDQSHQFDAWIDHTFNQNWQASLQDSFVYSQEPDLIGGGALPIRTTGNNLRNTGTAKLNTQWTRLLSSELDYQNTYYHYDSSFYSALLDRDENLASLDLDWLVIPTATVGIGYEFQQVNYTSSQFISPGVHAENRDSRSHIAYVKIQYNPLDNLTAALRVGAQFTDYYDPAAGQTISSSTQPWVDASLTYTYLPGSYIQIGFNQTRNAVPFTTPTATSIAEDEESSIVYGSINHQFTPQLVASLMGKVQYSTIKGGSSDGSNEAWYELGLNLSYAFNNHLSAEIGYNFDDLDSSTVLSALGQSYKRNRAYIGLTAAY